MALRTPGVKLCIDYAWDERAGCWVGVVRGKTTAFASSLLLLRFKIRMQLAAMPPEARFVMKLTGPDKPRPS